MANRTTFSNLSAPPVPGGGTTGFLQQYSERMKQLFDASALPLVVVGGTNGITTTLDPDLDGSGLVDGMKFTLTFLNTNTSNMTLRINGGSLLPLVDNEGTALIAGAVTAGMRALIEYIGGQFRILSPINAAASGGAGPYAITITASTTWNKPAGYADDTLVRFQAWGAGGGGASAIANAGGGGGGAYVERLMRWADVPASVVITIGTGGTATNAGGNTTIGSLVTAFGGGGGDTNGSGGGGGELQAGPTNQAAPPAARVGGGLGGDNLIAEAARVAGTIWGGGGGGTAGQTGGAAVWGGGGGGGRTAGVGGSSLFGGRGGNGNNAGTGAAGTAPGGGGGAGSTTGGAGARGEVRIQILG